MAKGKKKLPRDRVLAKARAAELARSTAGKARVFKDRSKTAPKADPEIEEGLDEYEEGAQDSV